MPRLTSTLPKASHTRAETRPEARGEAALGNQASKKAAPGSEDFSRALWRLQRTMWRITDFKRLAGCHRWLQGGVSRADVQWSPGKAKWGGLQTSSSVWASPVSAVRIAKLRAEEVSGAVQEWKNQGQDHSVEFLTLTLRHSKDQSLKEVWDMISYAWKSITQTASWRGGARMIGDQQRFGIKHWLKSVEVTIGDNGWHVHVHVLLFTQKNLSDDERGAMENRLFERWKNAAVRKGFRAPSRKNGIKIEEAVKNGDVHAMGAYIAKGAVASIGHEIASGGVKTARGASRTPFQILGDIATAEKGSDEYNRDFALWRVWEKESLGRRQMAWSKGAKDALGVNDVDDEKLLEENDELVDPFSVGQVAAENWNAPVPGTDTRLADSVDVRREILDYVKPASDPDDAAKRFSYVVNSYNIAHTSDIVQIQRKKSPLLVTKDKQRRDSLVVKKMNIEKKAD